METSVHTPPPSFGSRADAVTVDHGMLAQLCYHVRWTATLSTNERGRDAAPHAIIAGALLDVLGGDELKRATTALDLPDVAVDHTSSSAGAHRADAVELGLQLVSHFTSDGRHDLADLYQEATRRIAATPDPAS